jgi:photosystem II stability/assembly factor-like uncharacterized protein
MLAEALVTLEVDHSRSHQDGSYGLGPIIKNAFTVIWVRRAVGINEVLLGLVQFMNLSRSATPMIQVLPLLFALLAAPEPSWQRHASPVTDDLHNAFFVDDSHGWILAHQSGAVLHTTDGGASWKVQARLGEGFLESIHFVDARTGWICGDKGRLYRTRNGGGSWELRGLGEGMVFYGVRFPDPKRGFLVGLEVEAGRAVMFETGDGGDTWKRREDLPPTRAFADAVAFPSPSVGFAGGVGPILATRDGGRTWKVSHEPAGGFVRDLFFLDERTGWAVGHNGLVLRTKNGGEAWETLPSFTRNRLRSVFFLDAKRGWIVGDATEADPGVLFETRDGGAVWSRVEINAPDLHRFAKSPGRLWIVGKGGTILSR